MIDRTTITPMQPLVGFASAVILTGLLGCEATEAIFSSAPANDPPPRVAVDANPSQLVSDLDQRYIIGPTAARELDYRIDWQFNRAGNGVKHLVVEKDSVFALDGRNLLTRIRTEDGSRVWRSSVAKSVEDIFGINYVGDRVYVTSVDAEIVLEAASGSQIGKQPFEKVANTRPVVFGQFFIYGSSGGQLIWHAHSIGHQWRAYQVSHAIHVAPVLVDNSLVAVGAGGVVMVLSASEASQYWSRQLLDEVVARPAVGQDAVFVAGLDQHLRAYDLRSGRKLWQYLTNSALTDSPVLIDDHIYQQVSGAGLVCFEALPPDSPGGKVLWTVPEVKGNVLLKRRGNLFVWDEFSKMLTIVTASRGGMVNSFHLPQVKHLQAVGKDGHELFAASDDGRVIRLVPRT